MKRRLLIFLTLLLSIVFLFSGCSWNFFKESSSVSDASVYYIQDGSTDLIEAKVSVPEGLKEKAMAEFLVDQLLNPPAGCISPLCDGAKLMSVKIEDEIAKVNFTKEFTNLKDPKYTLSAPALAKTLCSLDFISGVNILVEGNPALGLDVTPIGLIMESDVMGESSDGAKSTVSLYFCDEMGEGLIKETREVLIPASSSVEKIIVEELLRGPVAKNAISAIPAGVKALSVETKNGVCFVNLSNEFLTKLTGGSSAEVLAVYSFVNSLTELDTISSVQFLIEGEKKESLPHMSINEPIGRKTSMIIQ